jgi:hypothetical protein
VQGACFEVENASNSWGARDRERTLHSLKKQRYLVLGDSFTEGYGVAQEKRFSELLEKRTGEEVLNFGISGNFGTIQEWQLYKHLGQKFDHSEVWLFFLPANDFDDNDPEQFPKGRYRPYLRENTSGNLELFYPVSFGAREEPKPMSRSRRIRRVFYNNIYLLNVIRQFGDAFESSSLKDAVDKVQASASRSRYQEFSAQDMKRVLYSFEQIANLAETRPFRIFIIPREVDFLAAGNSGKPHSPLVQAFQNFAKSRENVFVVDLLPRFLDYASKNNISRDAFFLPCDGHWSELGHEVVAGIVEQEREERRRSPSA